MIPVVIVAVGLAVVSDSQTKTLDLTGDRPLTLQEARKLKRWWQNNGWSADMKNEGRGLFSVTATKIKPF